MKAIMRRIYDLILKFVGVKGVFAISCSVAFLLEPGEETLIALLVAWSLLIGAREVSKALHLIKGKSGEE